MKYLLLYVAITAIYSFLFTADQMLLLGLLLTALLTLMAKKAKLLVIGIGLTLTTTAFMTTILVSSALSEKEWQQLTNFVQFFDECSETNIRKEVIALNEITIENLTVQYAPARTQAEYDDKLRDISELDEKEELAAISLSKLIQRCNAERWVGVI